MSGNKNVKGFLIGFFAGGTIGALVALLTTPKSGKEFRSGIKQKSEEYFDEADKYFTESKIKANEYINEGKRKYAMIMNDIKSKPDEMLKDAERVFNDTKVKTKDVLHSGKEKIEAETERLKSSVKAGIDAYKEAKNS
ncbi:MAG: YtxH domain-containing protein [Ignavibacteriaceae bacterium]|nr:YtxH domain-containing protein [Ignavibacteriaceae bacterium]